MSSSGMTVETVLVPVPTSILSLLAASAFGRYEPNHLVTRGQLSRFQVKTFTSWIVRHRAVPTGSIPDFTRLSPDGVQSRSADNSVTPLALPSQLKCHHRELQGQPDDRFRPSSLRRPTFGVHGSFFWSAWFRASIRRFNVNGRVNVVFNQPFGNGDGIAQLYPCRS